jgi:hypothetical protein
LNAEVSLELLCNAFQDRIDGVRRFVVAGPRVGIAAHIEALHKIAKGACGYVHSLPSSRILRRFFPGIRLYTDEFY